MFLRSKNKYKQFFKQILPAYLMIALLMMVYFPFKLLHHHSLPLFSESNQVAVALVHNLNSKRNYDTAFNKGNQSKVADTAIECWWCRLMSVHVFSAQARNEVAYHFEIPQVKDFFNYIKSSLQLHYPYHFNKGPPTLLS